MNGKYRTGIFTISLLAAAVWVAPALAERSIAVVNRGWEITWSDIAAAARHKETGARKELFQDERGETEEYGMSDFRMLSVVGTLVSWTNSWYYPGGAHPSYGTRLTALNLDPEGSASLADLFGEEAVFSRLMQDKVVEAALNGALAETGNQPHPVPQNLGELLQFVDGGCVADMGADMLTQYYFPYRLGGKVAVVEIGLSHGCEVNRGAFTELGRLYFPIPDALRADFDKAVRDGVLEDKPFQKPSYDCNKAGTAIEFAICTDAGLAGLDVEMAKRYKAARQAATGEARKRVKQDQRDWVAARNSECTKPYEDQLEESGTGKTFASTVACLAKSYETRLAEMK